MPVAVKLIAVGVVMITCLVVEHPLASVARIVYVPAADTEKGGVVATLFTL